MDLLTVGRCGAPSDAPAKEEEENGCQAGCKLREFCAEVTVKHIHVSRACENVHTYVSPWLHICACVSVHTYVSSCLQPDMHDYKHASTPRVRDQVAHTAWVCTHCILVLPCSCSYVSVWMPHPHSQTLGYIDCFVQVTFAGEPLDKAQRLQLLYVPCCSAFLQKLGLPCSECLCAGSRVARGIFPFEFCIC